MSTHESLVRCFWIFSVQSLTITHHHHQKLHSSRIDQKSSVDVDWRVLLHISTLLSRRLHARGAINQVPRHSSVRVKIAPACHTRHSTWNAKKAPSMHASLSCSHSRAVRSWVFSSFPFLRIPLPPILFITPFFFPTLTVRFSIAAWGGVSDLRGFCLPVSFLLDRRNRELEGLLGL